MVELWTGRCFQQRTREHNRGPASGQPKILARGVERGGGARGAARRAAVGPDRDGHAAAPRGARRGRSEL